ncbi:MAG: hypothetical protein LBP23_07130, partial [Treponema sp.]|nr:hypothetical protein [Treponema sp.]
MRALYRREEPWYGISEADIRCAIDTVTYDGRLEGDDTENRRLLIGFDRNTNPLEIYYNILDGDTVRVFHAMKCRNIYKRGCSKSSVFGTASVD